MEDIDAEQILAEVRWVVTRSIVHFLLLLIASPVLAKQPNPKEVLGAGERIDICVRARDGYYRGNAVKGTPGTDNLIVSELQKKGFAGARVCDVTKDPQFGKERLELVYYPVHTVVGGTPTYNPDGTLSGNIGGEPISVWSVDLLKHLADGKESSLTNHHWTTVCNGCLLSSVGDIAKHLRKTIEKIEKGK